MKTKVLLFACTFSTYCAMAGDMDYVWQSNDGNPENIQGSLVLDSSANSSGSISDILSLTFSCPAFGIFTLDPANFAANGFSVDTTAPFSWDASEITSMHIGASTVAVEGDHTTLQFLASANSPSSFQPPFGPGNGSDIVAFIPEGFNFDNDGAWVANPAYNAPDGGATSALLLTSLAGMGLMAQRKVARA